MRRTLAKVLLAAIVMVVFCPMARCQLAEQYDPPKPAGQFDTTCCAQRIAQSLADQLQDWAQFLRYRDDNIRLRQQPADPQRVVFIGDSIIAGWKLAEFFPAKPYVNRGIGGQTTQQILLRIFQDVIDLKPAAVVIEGGVNDMQRITGPETLAMVEENFQAMTELAQCHQIKVVLCTTTPASDSPHRKWTEVIPPDDVTHLNGWIRDYAARAHAGLADSYAALVDSSRGMRQGLSQDGVHPNASGYKLMAPVVEQAIAKSLN